jgi:hypothetical protein
MNYIGFIDQFTNWWESLNAARQTFYGIGLVAGFIALVLAVLSFIGMEHHDAVDAAGSADVDHGGGGILSIKPLTGFLLGFGLAGGMALDAGLPLIAAVGIACLAGALIMWIIVLMFRTIYAMKSDGTMRINDAVGAVGTVYVALPPKKGAGGQVVVNFNGRQETFAALSAAEQPITSGNKVKVVGIIDGRTVLVESL